jgi:acyl carrier protein
MRDVTFEQFAETLLTRLRFGGPVQVEPGTGLYDELELDSVHALEMIVVIENMADIVVPPPELPELWTVGDAFAYYRTCVEAASGEFD